MRRLFSVESDAYDDAQGLTDTARQRIATEFQDKPDR